MVDLNEHTLRKKITAFFYYLGIRELILKRHDKKSPATTGSKKIRQPIDEIWGTNGINILTGGYLPFNKAP